MGRSPEFVQPRSSDLGSKTEVVGNRPSPVKINKHSKRIRKAPLPFPAVQPKQPVVIHTYSPKVIQTDPSNFMWLVQRLTGSSDTRSRCAKNKPRPAAAVNPPCSVTGAVVDPHKAITDAGEVLTPAIEYSSVSNLDEESVVLDSSSESEGLPFMLDTMARISEPTLSGDISGLESVRPLSNDGNLSHSFSPSFDASCQGSLHNDEHISFPLLELTQFLTAEELFPSRSSPGLMLSLPSLSPAHTMGSPYKDICTLQNQLSPQPFRHSRLWDSRVHDLRQSPRDNLYRELSQIFTRDV